MTLYFDTSALVKLVVAEDGSELAEEFWASAFPLASSILAYPEGRAALAAAHRGGRISREGHHRARTAFEGLFPRLASTAVDEGLSRLAGELAARFGLRGYDAVHLASALSCGDGEVTLVSWDEDLTRAARSAGLSVAGAAG